MPCFTKMKSPYAFICMFILGLLLSWPQSAGAWKPVSHVFLAEVARLDVINDGKLEFYLVDYEKGEIIRKLGDYEVEPNLLRALNSGGPFYRASAWGADSIPDIAHSQLLIHPVWNDSTSNAWIEHLWQSAGGYSLPPASSDSYQTALHIKAFVLGFLTHAAGDMFGHSYINVFAGGPWDINEIAMRHMALEGYIDKRTLDTTPDDFYVTSIAGIEDFIYQQMLMATGLTGWADFLNKNFRKEDATPARFFNGLIRYLENKIIEYSNKISEYTRRYNAKVQEAKNCKPQDLSCSRVLLYREAARILAEQAGYILVHGPLILYFNNWISDIRDGLKAFPAPSYQAHVYNLFRKPYTYYTPPDEALRDWATDNLMSMLGLPDAAGQMAGYDIIWDNIPQWAKDTLEKWKAYFYNSLWESAFGMALKELEDFLDSIIDPIKFNNVPVLYRNDGCWLPMKDFNQCELRIQDAAYNNPDEKYDWRKFRPAYNTVVMNKLLLLSRAGLQQLLSDLGSSLDVSSTELPAILGFLNSFDEGNPEVDEQSASREEPKQMVLFKDLASYKKIFMRQRGIVLPGETEIPCGCQEPREEKKEEEVILDDLVSKYSHLDLKGRLQGFSATNEFLAVHTVPKEKEEVLTVFSEPEGRRLWQRKFIHIEKVFPPNPTLFENRIAVVASESEPTSKSVCFYVFDASTGKILFQKRAWNVSGRFENYIINREGEVLDLRTCTEVYQFKPSVKTFQLKAIIGGNVFLLRKYSGFTPAPYLFSLNDLKERWLDRKFSEEEMHFVSDKLRFDHYMMRNDFPVLFAAQPQTHRDSPFLFYLLTEKGDGRLLTPTTFGIAEPNQSCGIDFCYSLKSPHGAYLVAGINTMHLRKTGGYEEIIVALDEKGNILGRQEISLEDNSLHGSGMDTAGNLLLSLNRFRPKSSGLVLASYKTPQLKKNYEKEYSNLNSKPSFFIGNELFARGRIRQGNNWFWLVCVLNTKDGLLKACYPFPDKAEWKLVSWGDHMFGIQNQRYLFLPFKSAGKEEAYRLIRIPHKYKGYPNLI